jgi:deoxyribodipyrimidine photo-lyase
MSMLSHNDALVDSLTKDATIFWFRRDLRLDDNAGLYHALRNSDDVLPLFIFDSEILKKLEDPTDRRVAFIHQTLLVLNEQLQKIGTSLLVLYGNPTEIFQALQPRKVFCNGDYEPYARKRDQSVAIILRTKGSEFCASKDHVIFEKNEVVKDDGRPYTVFTPYSKKWKSTVRESSTERYPTEKYFSSFKKIAPLKLPSLQEVGFQSTDAIVPECNINLSLIERYARDRDFPALNGTTKLGVHLRFGTISIRKLVELARKKNEIFLNELIWREFYASILWHFPDVETKAFKPAYDHIRWKNDPEEFEKWCDGMTGYPLVDAGMRELNATGFMHNRVRMITASFLTKHLLIDWRWGELYYAKNLLDYDLASNNGNWQWAAGCGCDAAPYFRIFNPALQAKKFDPALKYIKKWIPELETDQYRCPIVDHETARARALEAYKHALNQ